MLDSKLKAVRSNIPMRRAVKAEQSALMDNYRKFASKYNAEKPKIDPLLAQKLKREVRDVSPGNIKMMSMHAQSRTSLDNISVEYNERALVGQRPAFRNNGNLMRKSQSISLAAKRNSRAKRNMSL